jgi:hypothetical protein
MKRVTIHQLTSSKKPLSTHANAHATEAATAVFLDSIFKRDHRIDLAIPAIDAARCQVTSKFRLKIVYTPAFVLLT